ncbi:MAG: hypothetical protein H7256_03780 [Bdellovibrio sp.]|nr:hypothetical protein [Bdellovibrio sp.]
MIQMKILTIAVVAVFCIQDTYAQAIPKTTWDLNDVSYLLPLPEKIGPDQLLKITSAGNGGEILPFKYFQGLPQLTGDLDKAGIRENLRAIAVRIDPCFPADPPLICKKQIRLVWQILIPELHGATEAVDAAIHAFYTLTDSDFLSLILDLQDWKSRFAPSVGRMPLQVHPAWKDQLDKSPSLLAFQKIITKYAGAKTISRVTVMTVRNLGQTWGFVGADIVDDKLKVMTIPRINSRAQIFINQANPADTFLGQITPSPGANTAEIADTINHIITDSHTLQKDHEQMIRDELKSIYRIENPKVFNPTTMDCVSCHAAAPAKEWVAKKRGDIVTTDLFSENAYQNFRYDLTNTSADITNTQIIRAFGYFRSGPAISQRIINESAEVADSLNGLTIKKSIRARK